MFIRNPVLRLLKTQCWVLRAPVPCAWSQSWKGQSASQCCASVNYDFPYRYTCLVILSSVTHKLWRSPAKWWLSLPVYLSCHLVISYSQALEVTSKVMTFPARIPVLSSVTHKLWRSPAKWWLSLPVYLSCHLVTSYSQALEVTSKVMTFPARIPVLSSCHQLLTSCGGHQQSGDFPCPYTCLVILSSVTHKLWRSPAKWYGMFMSQWHFSGCPCLV